MTLESLLQKAAKQQASDVHLLANMPPYMRIDGELMELDKKSLAPKEIETLVKEIIDEAKFKKFVLEKELDLAYEAKDGSRFRVNLHWEKNNIGLSARTIPATIPTMEDVGMPPVLFDLCNMDKGLIIVTGPTGCGKSTSLAAMINYINNSRKANIITFEDPIEFIFKPIKSLIRQRQLATDMLTFENGLVHVLRQDPNVIMVGEMRDLETIATTITLAETGHLVFATLHTYSAAQTIDRIIDIFPPFQQNQIRMQLSTIMRGIVTQRLVPKKDGGRVAAREILINNSAIANMIRENKISQIKNTIQTSAREGMVTMENALIKLYKDGIITKEMMEANLYSPANSYLGQ